MKLHELGYEGKTKKNKKRVGRGPASGMGKTCGRGTKGQNSRSGGGVRPGFEGGQMPIYRRLPKRGFTNINTKKYKIINLNSLNKFEEGSYLSVSNFVRNNDNNIKLKVLADGKIDKKLFVKAHKFSKKAKKLIIDAGGSVEVIL